MSDERPQQRSSIFTNGLAIYDNNHSSVQLGFVDRKAMITFLPVFPAMKGKDPVKGEKMYNSDAKAAITLDYRQIQLVKRQIELLENEEIDECMVESEKRTLTISGADIFDGIENVSLMLTTKESNLTIMFEFQPKEVILGSKYVDDVETKITDTVYHEWELFKEFINAAYLNHTGVVEHAVRVATNNAPGRARVEGGVEPPKRKLGGSSDGPSRLGGGTTPKDKAAPKAPAGKPEDYFDDQFTGDEDV
jgi:hypothetical protein